MRKMLTLNLLLLCLIASSISFAVPATAQSEPEPTASPTQEPTPSPTPEATASPEASDPEAEPEEETTESEASEEGEAQEDESSEGEAPQEGETAESDLVDVGELHDTIPWLELSVIEDTLDDVHNGQLDSGDCTVDVTWPQKVQEPQTGQYFVASSGSATCPGYDYLEVKICVQIKVAGAWKRLNCYADGGFTSSKGASVLGPCRAGTWKYRSKFTWAASYVATDLQTSQEVAIDAASSGTRKVPRDGVKRTCPA